MYKLFEDYINSPEVKIYRIFDEFKINILRWFEVGALQDFQLEGGTEDNPEKAIGVSKKSNTLDNSTAFLEYFSIILLFSPLGVRPNFFPHLTVLS